MSKRTKCINADSKVIISQDIFRFSYFRHTLLVVSMFFMFTVTETNGYKRGQK
jgi:hypothetical protein